VILERIAVVRRFFWIASPLLALGLIAWGVYVKTFSHVTLAGNSLPAEQVVRVIYSPHRLKQFFTNDPTVDFIRVNQDMAVSLRQQLSGLNRAKDEIAKLKSAKCAKLWNLSTEALISQFPDETNGLATANPNVLGVQERPPPRTHPALDTRQLASALGISYSDALRLKWGLNEPVSTTAVVGSSYGDERASKFAAISRIMRRPEYNVATKDGKTESDLQAEIDKTRTLLTQISIAKAGFQTEALNKLANVGTEMPTRSPLRILRKPALLIFQQHGWVFELSGSQFNVMLNAEREKPMSFDEYLLRD
jgi:hypothetical protein